MQITHDEAIKRAIGLVAVLIDNVAASLSCFEQSSGTFIDAPPPLLHEKLPQPAPLPACLPNRKAVQRQGHVTGKYLKQIECETDEVRTEPVPVHDRAVIHETPNLACLMGDHSGK
jgi:hypothetical protein